MHSNVDLLTTSLKHKDQTIGAVSCIPNNFQQQVALKFKGSIAILKDIKRFVISKMDV